MLDTELAPAIVDRSRDLGLLVNAARLLVLSLMPSLRITEDEVALALSLLRQAAEDILSATAATRPRRKINGSRGMPTAA